jgi:hypothetical protein
MKKFKQSLIAASVFAVFLLNYQVSLAGENAWVYVQGTDVRPKGSVEMKITDRWRIGKDHGDYSFHDIRPNIELGITNKWTVSATALFYGHNYSVEDPDLNPMFETQTAAGGRFNKSQYAGYSYNTKYNILSPYKDFIGLSVGFQFQGLEQYRLDGGDIEQKSYIPKIWLQKNWLDDTLTVAINFQTEFERRKSPGILEEEIAFDGSIGVSYRVAPKHFIGFEYRRQEDHLSPFNTETGQYDEPSLKPSEFDLTNIKLGSRHQYGQYIGPSYHYAERSWWATVGILMQVSGGGSEFAYNRGSLNLDEHEKYHIGLIFGYEFQNRLF